MDNFLKIVIGAVVAALLIGSAGLPALAYAGLGMMDTSNFNIGAMRSLGTVQGMMNGMMGGITGSMTGANFDMNAMHKAMHGENSDADMNAIHQRMVSGNLTQEDWNEMREHCPIMGGS